MDDAEAVFDLYSRPEVTQYLGSTRLMESLSDAQERLAQRIAEWEGSEYGFWAAVHKDSGRIAGASILKPLPNDTKIEVGWHVHPDFWNQGIATEMGVGAIHHGFETLGLSDIYAIVFPPNEASKRVAIKCGMAHLGQTDAYHDLTLDFFHLSRP